MSKLFNLPQPPSSHARELAPAPDGARGRDAEIAALALTTPAALEREEQAEQEGRDFAARTTTVRRAAYERHVRWALGTAVLTLALGPAVGLLFAGVTVLTHQKGA
jgi:hypothetical protein